MKKFQTICKILGVVIVLMTVVNAVILLRTVQLEVSLQVEILSTEEFIDDMAKLLAGGLLGLSIYLIGKD